MLKRQIWSEWNFPKSLRLRRICLSDQMAQLAQGKLFSLKIKRKIFLFICFYKISFFAVRFFQYLIKNDIKKNVKCGETTRY